MTRQRASAASLVLLGTIVGFHGRRAPAADPAPASTPAPDPKAVAILQALQGNPLTAPYRFSVGLSGRQYVLSGRVATRQIHDAAIRMLIALGYPIRDELVIDTGEAYRLAAQAQMQAQSQARGGMQPGYGAGMGLANNGLAYVYPPPLFGRLDDPFFGLEPPLLTYAPWSAGLYARRDAQNAAFFNGPGAMPNAGAAAAPAGNPAPALQGNGAAQPAGAPLASPVEMTLDSQGNATLRGRVPSFADRVALGQEVARTPGIVQVINLLEIDPSVRVAMNDTPPPPPTPAFFPAPNAEAINKPATAAEPAPKTIESTPIAVEGDPLARRVSEALGRRPALATATIQVSSRDGVATLSGDVPSAYEAMLAFRAAQQTPGVREVVDRLAFAIPDVDKPNPLREKGRPQDVEAYLLAQVRKQVGDLAHVDQVRINGDALEVHGTVSRADDVARAEAALRSIPLLRGYRLEPDFLTD